VLGLEPRAEPREGLDARQLGNLYHRIMEAVYRAVEDPTNLERLLEALPQVAAPILDEAPRREQFRPTAWWEQTRAGIVENVRDSLRALDELRGEYVPHAFERPFGLSREPGAPLVIRGPEGRDTFRLHGLIDRVDRTPDGRLRVIDYKTGGHSAYTKGAFLEGKKLQLPLYALAAQEALGLGEVADGYYWHVRQAGWHLENKERMAWISLAKMGVTEAIERAMAYAWETVRDVREGRFVPQAPEEGCPGYCPAASFCWHYDQR
jgi:ATP-dependent helicase/DNAse subunit B